MRGHVYRLIRKHGVDASVINSESTGGAELPTGTDDADGTMRFLIHELGPDSVNVDSFGEDTDQFLTLKAFPTSDSPELKSAGGDGRSSVIDHPKMGRLRLIHKTAEDDGSLTLQVVTV